MKCWPTTARRGSLHRTGWCILSLALLTGGAVSQETTLHSQSNIVLIPALVRDSRGGVVYGLHAKDFVVEDDGVEQPVHLDEPAEGQAISLVIAIQRGRRASREFPRIRSLSSMLDPIVSQGLAKVAVVEFDSNVKGVHDFTSNPDRIAQDLNDLQPGDKGSAILDAIDYSVKLLDAAPRERPRVLLLISETRDHGSHAAKIDDVVAAIGLSNVVVYALVFSPYLSEQLDVARGANRDEWHSGIDFLSKIMDAREAMRKNTPKTVAAMTGGEYELFPTQKKFEARLIDFTNHLHSRYMLSIEPRNPHPGLHQIHVRLREPGDATVAARATYWAKGNE